MSKKSEKDEAELKEDSNESELEEVIEEDILEKIEEDVVNQRDFIDEPSLSSFLQSSVKYVSPVLEQIAQAQEPINLEQGVAIASTNNEEKGQVKYSTATDEQTEKDYSIQEERVSLQQMQSQRTQLGEVAFINPEAQRLDRLQQKEDYQLETQTVEREKSNLPFQQQERKYKPAKFNQ